MLTKTEEIARYAEFLASLPADSYLADLLADSLPLVKDQIEQDLAMPGAVKTCLEIRAEYEKEAKQAQAAALKERNELIRLGAEKLHLERVVCQMKAEARKLVDSMNHVRSVAVV
jgi:hypothetical protein